MSKYSLSDYINLSQHNLPLENILEELFLSACESYLEDLNPPTETIERIRTILEPNKIKEIIPQIKYENPSLFSYYVYQELWFKISTLINKIKHLEKESSNIDQNFLNEAKKTLENLRVTRNSNYIPIQEMEYVDSIFEKITF
jgi:hypothetical protein